MIDLGTWLSDDNEAEDSEAHRSPSIIDDLKKRGLLN